MTKLIANIIATLPDNEKNVLVLIFHEKLNSEEIALVMGITIYDVIRLYTKAVVHLRLSLRGHRE